MSIPPPHAVARYHAGDKTLEVSCDVAPAALRVSVGTVTFLFSADRVLVGIDAYTNSERWARQTLVYPTPAATGAAKSEGMFDDHGIAPSSQGPVDFVYDEQAGVLKLEMEGSVDLFARVLSCVLLGLDHEGQPVEVWLEGVHVDG